MCIRDRYIAGDLDTKKIVDIDAEQLQEVIEQILEGQNVSCEIKDKNIIIRKKEVEQSMLNEKKLQDISGLVMDVIDVYKRQEQYRISSLSTCFIHKTS